MKVGLRTPLLTLLLRDGERRILFMTSVHVSHFVPRSGSFYFLYAPLCHISRSAGAHWICIEFYSLTSSSSYIPTLYGPFSLVACLLLTVCGIRIPYVSDCLMLAPNCSYSCRYRLDCYPLCNLAILLRSVRITRCTCVTVLMNMTR